MTNKLTEEQHERDARIQIVLDSYLQTYIDKKPVEEILKAKKKLFEAVDKEVSEAESRAVEQCIEEIKVMGADFFNENDEPLVNKELVIQALGKALSQVSSEKKPNV